MSAIVNLAQETLDDQELDLAEHLSVLLSNDQYDAGLVVAAILPKYYEGDRTLQPDSIYRTLYYVDQYAALRDFEGKTRTFLDMVSGHIENCLFHLYAETPHLTKSNVPFGTLVQALHNLGLLSDGLTFQLRAFNKVVNIPAKHFNAYSLPSAIGRRTFSVPEAAFAFMIMRKLSVPLFALLKEKGVEMKADWPPFDPKWLEWSPLVPGYQSEVDPTEIP